MIFAAYRELMDLNSTPPSQNQPPGSPSREPTADFFDKIMKMTESNQNGDVPFSDSVFCIAFVDSAKTKRVCSAGPGHGFRTLWQFEDCSSFDEGERNNKKTKQKEEEDNLPSRGAEELKNIDRYTIQLMSKR